MDLETIKKNLVIPTTRMRRLREHPRLRDLVREHELTVNDLVHALFIKEGHDIKHPIQSMPGHFQLSIDHLADEIKSIRELNIPAVLLYGIPTEKDGIGSASWRQDGVIQTAARIIKEQAPDILIIADLCFCEYTDHGHCGVMTENNGEYHLDNDATLALLVKQAISLVEAGCDVVAPSGMLDGMVAAVRKGLDSAGYTHIPILSFAVKYASSMYGPFREAAEGAPRFGDRRSHQMDPANGMRGLREAELDIAEGADMLMVKPAQIYLDVVYRVKQQFPSVPLVAYQVSGEYAMLKAAAMNGWLDEERVMLESLLSMKRAGADFIITYFAKQAAECLQHGKS